MFPARPSATGTSQKPARSVPTLPDPELSPPSTNNPPSPPADPAAHRYILVKNLPAHVTEAEVRALFPGVSSITEVIIIKNSNNIYLRFTDQAEVKAYITRAQSDGTLKYKGKKLDVCLVSKLPLDLNDKSSIVLTTIYKEKIEINVKTVHDLFAEFGAIRKVVIFKKKNYQVFIEFESPDDAQFFKQALNNLNYKGFFFLKIQFTSKKDLVVNGNNFYEFDFEHAQPGELERLFSSKPRAEEPDWGWGGQGGMGPPQFGGFPPGQANLPPVLANFPPGLAKFKENEYSTGNFHPPGHRKNHMRPDFPPGLAKGHHHPHTHPYPQPDPFWLAPPPPPAPRPYGYEGRIYSDPGQSYSDGPFHRPGHPPDSSRQDLNRHHSLPAIPQSLLSIKTFDVLVSFVSPNLKHRNLFNIFVNFGEISRISINSYRQAAIVGFTTPEGQHNASRALGALGGTERAMYAEPIDQLPFGGVFVDRNDPRFNYHDSPSEDVFEIVHFPPRPLPPRGAFDQGQPFAPTPVFSANPPTRYLRVRGLPSGISVQTLTNIFDTAEETEAVFPQNDSMESIVFKFGDPQAATRVLGLFNRLELEGSALEVTFFADPPTPHHPYPSMSDSSFEYAQSREKKYSEIRPKGVSEQLARGRPDLP